jgi:spore coat protein U domain-containing protein, fimbrial subunit CupE1/2/3/6
VSLQLSRAETIGPLEPNVHAFASSATRGVTPCLFLNKLRSRGAYVKRLATHRHITGLASIAGIATVLALGASNAWAETASSTFTVSANVLAVCSVSATNLDFGDYNASHPSSRDSTSTLSMTCTNGQDYVVALDGGTGPGATVADRKMTNGVHTLGYQLYTNAANSTVWGDGTLSTGTVTGTGDGQQQSLTVHGKIPSGQHASSGSYSDTITVTLTY